jgi:hypothetical protein
LELISVRIYTKCTKNELNCAYENDSFVEISHKKMFVFSVGVETWNDGAAFKAYLDFAEAIEEKRINRHQEIDVVGLLICLILYLEITLVHLNAVSVLDHLAVIANTKVNKHLNERVN